ncbi:hypothetical protein K3495_g8563 [Podosphaera aphanis]|nr:hypothetical protein K3495_g8563 [Podosphaera aphanis]
MPDLRMDSCYSKFSQEPLESIEAWASRIAAPISVDRDSYLLIAEENNTVGKIEEILSHFVLEEKKKKEEAAATAAAEEDDDSHLVKETEDKIDVETQGIMIERLRGILPDLAVLWRANSKQLCLAVEKLADGSRDYKWRIPIGESGILNFFLEVIGYQEITHDLKVQTLRLIGNSCADRDRNRERIAASKSYLPSIILQLRDASLLPFTLPVLFNVCVDYEPTQLLASKSFLTRDLINLISSSTFDKTQPFLEYVCRILALLASQQVEIEYAPNHTPITLLKVAMDHESPTDLETFISLVNIAVSYLQHEKFQKFMLSTEKNFDIISTILIDSYSRSDSNIPTELNLPVDDSAKALSSMRTALIQALSEISVLPNFDEACPISSQFSSTLQSWLLSTDSQVQLQVAACIVLGNLARHDATCIQFVQSLQIHHALVNILSKKTSSQLLHSTLGFLKNLAIPLENKKILGQAEIFPALSRVWALDVVPEVRFISISLARQLTIGTFENVCQLLQQSSLTNQPNLTPLMSVFDNTDDEPIKMEVARLTTSICRVLHSHSEFSREELEPIRQNLYQMDQEVSSQLGFVVSQNKWPVVRSEGWFVMALMARFHNGAEFISRLLCHAPLFQSLLGLLSQQTNVEIGSPTTISSHPSTDWSEPFDLGPEPTMPDGPATKLARLDRENVLVLISEMLKNSGNKMTAPRRATFKELLKGGGEMLLKLPSPEIINNT